MVLLGGCAVSFHELSTVLDKEDGISLHPTPYHKKKRYYRLPTDTTLYTGPGDRNTKYSGSPYSRRAFSQPVHRYGRRRFCRFTDNWCLVGLQYFDEVESNSPSTFTKHSILQTRSSPQWRSGRSTNLLGVLNLL